MSIRKPSTEHSPMSRWDEFPIHQIGEPVRVVANNDARAFERYWFTAEDTDGEFFLAMGVGFYPNLGTADAYVIFNSDSKHTCVHAHRLLDEDRGVLEVGPIKAEPVRAFEEWHLAVGPNEQGLQVDLRWYDTKRAVFHARQGPSTVGRLGAQSSGYETFGRVEGLITLGDRVYTLERTSTIGSRDHHWGARNGVGGPAYMDPQPRFTHVGQWVEFREFGIWGSRLLHNKGSAVAGAMPILRSTYKMRFDAETHHFTGGVFTNLLADGRIKEVTYEQIDDKVIYLRCGMYTGPAPDNLGEPETNLHHGEYVGDLVAGSSYDVSDPQVRVRLAGFDEHFVRATCDGESTVGIIEVSNPVIYEWCRDGRPGYELL
jgi:hypothetical protein